MTAAAEVARRIAIAIVEDHSVVREGLIMLVQNEPDMIVISQTGSLQEAVQVETDPDVVLADLALPDARGAETVRRLRERFGKAKIVVLTMLGDLHVVRESLAEGANGYLLKEAAASELINAIRIVARGGEYLHPTLGAALAKTEGAQVAGRSSLSPREKEVLRLIALGHTNSEAAEILRIAPKTIEAHRNHISQKLGLKTRAELVRFAIQSGLIDRT